MRWERARALVLLATLGLAACGGGHEGAAPTTRVRRGDFRRTLVVRGRLAAEKTSVITAGTRGKLSYLVPEGTIVAKDEVLFRLETDEIEQELATVLLDLSVAEANATKAETEQRSDAVKSRLSLQEKNSQVDLARLRAEEARSEFARKRRQVEADLLPRVELAAAELALQQAELTESLALLDVERSQEEMKTRTTMLRLDRESALAQQSKVRSQVDEKREYLEKATVVAPASGVVVHSSNWNGDTWKVGDEVWRSTKVVELPDLDTMEVKLEVNEIDAAALAVGLAAETRVEALPELRLPGKVREIAGLAEEVRDDEGKPTGLHAFAVRIQVGQQDARLRPGMSARVEILVESLADALIVPAAAVRNDAEGEHVLTPDGRVAVTVRSRNHDEVALASGPGEGDLVLLTSGGGADAKPAVAAPPAPADAKPAAAAPSAGTTGAATAAPAAAPGGALPP